MEYPNNFDVPAFPAGKRIAISRFMAIGVSILCLVSIFMCGLIFWTYRSQKFDPIIVSINPETSQWTVIKNSNFQAPVEYSVTRTLQESVINNFITKWFLINANETENENLWKLCDRKNECNGVKKASYTDNSCAIFCVTGEELFSSFTYDIVPDYQERFANGETWLIDNANIQIEPASKISESGGMWKIEAKIISNISEPINIVAFAKVVRSSDISKYQMTMGYYVADFNAYKITNQ